MPNLIISQSQVKRVIVPFRENSQVVICDSVIGLVRSNDLLAIYKRGVLIYRSGDKFDYDLFAQFENHCSNIPWNERVNPISQPDDYFTFDLLH